MGTLWSSTASSAAGAIETNVTGARRQRAHVEVDTGRSSGLESGGAKRQRAHVEGDTGRSSGLESGSASARPLKRPKHEGELLEAEKDTGKLSEGESKIIDATPDGKTHRFKVRCPALFWGNKKDVLRVIRRLQNFPPYTSVHKISKWDYFFISFPNAAAAADGTAKLALVVHKGDVWTATKVASQSARKTEIQKALNRSRDERYANEEGVCRTAADVTAPWRDVAYEDQLARKEKLMTRALSAVTETVWRERFYAGSVPWADALRTRQSLSSGSAPPCCRLRSMEGATGDYATGLKFYRNKNEFTIGFSPSSCGMGHTHHVRKPTVGFSLGLVRDGEMRIAPVGNDCVTTAVPARTVAQVVESVVRRSGILPYDKVAHDGYWRQIMCRLSGRTRTIVVIVMVTSLVRRSGSSVDADTISDDWTDSRCRREVAQALDERFADSEYDWGLFWQVSDHVSLPASEVDVEWVDGVKSLEEELLGMRFRVHPRAFFQVNTRMAERLYETVGELGGLSPASVLLDICCGTGTIGLALSKRVRRVVGIEMCEAAVEDAKHNAKLNNIKNAYFVAGRVEDKIRDVLAQVSSMCECVAVLDPPRAGVHNNVRTASLPISRMSDWKLCLASLSN